MEYFREHQRLYEERIGPSRKKKECPNSEMVAGESNRLAPWKCAQP